MILLRPVLMLLFWSGISLAGPDNCADRVRSPTPSSLIIPLSELLPSQKGLRRNTVERERMRLGIRGTGRLKSPISINIFPEDGRKLVLDGHHTLEAARLAGKTVLQPGEYRLTHYTYKEFLEINFAVGWITPFDPRTHFRLAETEAFKRLIRLMQFRGVPARFIEDFIWAHPEAYSISFAEMAETPEWQQPFEGGRRDIEAYLNRLDASMPQKIGQMLPSLPRDGVVYEPGTGSGRQSAAYAAYYPNLLVVASDLDLQKVRYAQSHYPLNNLVFLKADATQPLFPAGFLDGKIDSSLQHHLTPATSPTLRAQMLDRYRKISLDELRPGRLHGSRTLVFSPWPDRVELDLPSTPAKALEHAPFGIRSYAQMLQDYIARYRSLVPERPADYTQAETERTGFVRFNLPKEIAMNFLWRMGYTSEESIFHEGQVLYAAEDSSGQIERSERLGGQVIFAEEQHNPYIVQNWWQSNGVQVFDPNTHAPLDFPATNYIQITRKPRPEDPQQLSFQKKSSNAGSWLEQVSYRRGDTAYDLVRVPGVKRTYIPYEKKGETAWLYLDPAVERPALLLYAEQSSLNKAHYFGLIPEVLGHLGEPSVPVADDFEATLKTKAFTVLGDPDRRKVSFKQTSRFLANIESTNELVEQTPVDMNETAESVVFFTERLQPFELNQVLSANHTGAIPNPLIELAAYRIGLHTGAHFNQWFGSQLPVDDQPLNVPVVASYSALKKGDKDPFLPVDLIGGFMDVFHGEVVRRYRHRKETAPWDIAVPRLFSPDIFSVIPYEVSNGVVYVGLELKDFASLHDRGLPAQAYVIPSWRMEKGLKSHLQAEQSLRRKMMTAGLRARQLLPLGSGYFPSMGNSAERVTPFAARIDSQNPPRNLVFVPLENLIAEMETVVDLHTRLSVYRLAHALLMKK